MKLYHFVDWDISFIKDLGDAIAGLSSINSDLQVISYSYNNLRQNTVQREESPCILFLEGGQGQPHHSGWTIKKFKEYFPQSKVVVWLSDSQYYRVVTKQLQVDSPELIDLAFELTPACVPWINSFGIKTVTIPWTISRKLHDSVTLPLDLTCKVNDFIFLANISGQYRQSLVDFLRSRGKTVITGGSHADKNLHNTYTNVWNSWISIGSSSHNRPELNLPGQRTMKGYRDALGIACNCLLILDNDIDTKTVWDNDFVLYYPWNNFDMLINYLLSYKKNTHLYEYRLKEQRQWLKKNLLDDLIYAKLVENGILGETSGV